MILIVNEYTTIKNFKRLGEFEEVMKYGYPSKYEKFEGTLKGKEVKGLICLADDNIYGLTLKNPTS